MYMKNFVLVLLCIHIAHIGYSQSIQTSTIVASKDALIDNQNPTTNYGSATSIEAGVKISGGITTVRRSYLDFDLSGIPSNAIVTSATLSMRVISEGSDVTNSSFVLERANASWIETGTGSITWSNKPAVITSDAVSTSSVSSGWRSITVTDHVQKMINSTFSKFGWSLRRNNEVTATLGSTYRSKNYSFPADRPKLVVNYYIPFSISAATINHASNINADDGSISITVANGPSSPTYQWYYSNGSAISGATSSTLNNLEYGWYGVKVSGTTGSPEYFSFLIGAQCDEVAISYNPGPDYIDDAPIYSSALTGNYGSSVDFLDSKNYIINRWVTSNSLIKFRLWIDPNIVFNQAGLNLYATTHDITNSNASYLKKVTSTWAENTVTWNNVPTTTTTNQVSLAASTTTTQNYPLINFISFWNDWKTSNGTNYGVLLDFQTTTNSQRAMCFHSSDGATSSLRPNFEFVISLEHLTYCEPQTIDDISYSELKYQIDGGYATTFDSKLKFSFLEEEAINSGNKIPYQILNKNNVVLASSDLSGTTTGGAVALNYNSNSNYKILDLGGVSSLTDGEFYTLEVTMINGQKKKLRFQFKQ